ncbi:hypothetical protein [Desulfobulbus alkaliphilus]|uniref:hypothetical protein n=1 Tax=Desulfobulbus alkaliphilus TaxID=869814 RepID=UPI001966B88E|nr:hypothetical protein [Desulfobulbus alkaliphilus]MBM9536162.1 hypothetical protein [Desulfobulbus alkaliphilus]
MAAMTPAERQKRYRKRALRDPEGLLLARLQVMLGPHASANLDRICQKTGWSKREAVEKALNDLAKSLQCNDTD